MPEQTWSVLRARIGGLSRDRAPDDPELLAARRDLAAIKLREHVRKTVDAVPLTGEQMDDIISILRGGSRVC